MGKVWLTRDPRKVVSSRLEMGVVLRQKFNLKDFLMSDADEISMKKKVRNRRHSEQC